MNIILDKQSQNFLIKNELTEFQIDILSKNNNFIISENQNIFLLSLKKDTQCLVKFEDDIIEFSFDKKIPYLQLYRKYIVNKINDVKNIKIGVTLLLLDDVKSFFNNGINQNSLFTNSKLFFLT